MSGIDVSGRGARRSALWVAALLATTALATTALTPSVDAQSDIQTAQAEARNFDIPAQPLTEALIQFGRQAGLQTSADASLIQTLRSTTIRGVMPWRQALDALLKGTGLSYRISGSMVTVERVTGAGDGAVQLDPVTVEGLGENAWGPVGGIVAKQSATATKSDTPLIETPRSVSVVTKEEMQLRGGARTYADALTYTPGFYTNSPANTRQNASAFVRGYNVFYSQYADGLALPNGLDRANPQIEPYGLERIELLKGPASVLYGQVSPGGLVNMVTKRPTFEPLREVQFQLGNYGHYQPAFDFSDRIDSDGRFAYRLTGLFQKSGTQIDYTDDDRVYLAPAFTWRPTSDTSLTILTHYRKNTGADQYATIPNEIAPQLPTNRFVGEPGFDKNDTQQISAGWEFTHRFNPTWKITQNSRYFQTKVDYRTLDAAGLTGNPALPGEVYRTAYLLDETLKTWTSDTRVQSNFETGAVKHEVVTGVDYRNQRSNNISGYYYQGAPPIDLFNPIYGTPLPDYEFNSAAKNSIRQVGVYAQDQVRLGGWVLSFGGRHDWAESTTDLDGTDFDSKTKDSAFTGNVGLLYHFENGFAPYVSFAQSFVPQAGSDAQNNPFKPTTGEQYEAGVKYQPPGLDAFVTLSAFHLTQQNTLTADLENILFQKQVGETRVKGLELEGKATIGNFDLIGSVTQLATKITKDNDGNEGNRIGYAPNRLASAFVNYKFAPGFLQGFNIGGGVRYVGSSYGDNENTVLNGSTTYFDAIAGFEFGAVNPTLEGLRFDVTVLNVTDRKDLHCDGPFGCQWGQRLTALGTLSYKW